MNQLIYLSQVDTALTPAELTAILLQARENNKRRAITGALVYGDGHFMQLLEGEEPVVTALYQRIMQDPRHRGIRKLANKTISKRGFQSWSMAFAEVTSQQLEQLAGYILPTEFEQHPPTGNVVDDLLLEKMKEFMRPVLQR